MDDQFLASNTTTYNQQYILYLFVAFIPEYCKWFGSLKKKKLLTDMMQCPLGLLKSSIYSCLKMSISTANIVNTMLSQLTG